MKNEKFRYATAKFKVIKKFDRKQGSFETK